MSILNPPDMIIVAQPANQDGQRQKGSQLKGGDREYNPRRFLRSRESPIPRRTFPIHACDYEQGRVNIFSSHLQFHRQTSNRRRALTGRWAASSVPRAFRLVVQPGRGSPGERLS